MVASGAREIAGPAERLGPRRRSRVGPGDREKPGEPALSFSIVAALPPVPLQRANYAEAVLDVLFRGEVAERLAQVVVLLLQAIEPHVGFASAQVRLRPLGQLQIVPGVLATDEVRLAARAQ